MPGLGNEPPGGAGKTVLPLRLRDGRNSKPALNTVGGIVVAEAMSAPRLVELICHSGPCGVPAIPVVVRTGAITVLTAGTTPLAGRTDGTKGAEKVGGKWNVPSVSTVRDDSGAWLLLK